MIRIILLTPAYLSTIFLIGDGIISFGGLKELSLS
jgi:hypothetical protein